MTSLEAALVDAGWKEVATMHLQSESFSASGIIEAGLINDGRRRLEVYRVADAENASIVAGIISGSGDPVFICGRLVVLIPPGTGDDETTRILESIGFQRLEQFN